MLTNLMEPIEKAQLMSSDQIERTIRRLAREILDHNRGQHGLALVGIRRRGVPLAERLATALWKMQAVKVPVGHLDINLYRDDLSTVATQPIVQSSEIDFPVEPEDRGSGGRCPVHGAHRAGRHGRPVDYGRPKAIQLCVLIDRGHRELPIQAHFVGKTVETDAVEMVEVRLNEVDHREGVLLVEPAS